MIHHSNRNRGFGSLAEINVTPLVDVMLVLLIVFMISAPMMQQGVQVDLPKANAGSLNEVPDNLVLSIKGNQQILINDKAVSKGTLRKKLQAIASVKPKVQVFVYADQSVPYGFVAQVIAEIRKSNIQKVGLVTRPSEVESTL